MVFRSFVAYSILIALILQPLRAETPFTLTLQWIQERMIRPSLGARSELIHFVSKYSTEAREVYLSVAKNESLSDAVLIRTSVGANRALKQAVFVSGAESGASGFRVHVASVGEFKYARYVADVNEKLYEFWISHSLSTREELRRIYPQLVQVASQQSTIRGVSMNVITYKLKDLQLFELDAQDLKQILRIFAEVPGLEGDFVRLF